MKLQNMTVIFIIIMIPIIVVVSYYIGLQINTITMQKDYTVKLQTAAKDSIQALEINTVEWNSASSNLADSKRRDVLAAINTFTTSLANSMGIGGAGKGRIQTYIPAIAYTMYDGYYIYSASLMQNQDTNSEGLTQFETDSEGKTTGNILYKDDSSYQYILKPYSPYSARYVKDNIDITVNYTLDNYIRVYGTVDGEYQTKEGYLVVCGSNSNEGVNNVKNGRISEIKYRGAEIKPETLKENVYIVGEEVKEYPYIYDQYDNKLYWDGSNYFSVDKNNNKVYLQTALPEGDAGFSITNRFRKISIPMYDNREDEWTVQKVFQILNPGGGYKFYYENQSGAFVEFTSVENIDGSDNKKLAGVEVEKDKDFSAINYCVESYVFTKWVTKNLGSITVGDMQISTGNSINSLKNITSAEQQYYGQYNNVDDSAKIFKISEDNNPDPENDTAYAESVLAQHKKDIIINTIEKNLSQATEQAKKMNPNYEYRLPQLSYDEWEQALSNISIIAFMQGMPIGLKYYNNYAIATSTLNKEFVDPDELYFAGKDDQYYHQRQCEQATGSDYVGYRSIDYVAKSYEKSDNGTTSTKYYYPHANSTNSELECYYCLVNRSTYSTYKKEANANWTDANWTDSYYNALARERYMQLDEPGTYKPNVTITKVASANSVEYGEDITYTITIKNNGIVDDTIYFADIWKKNEIAINGEIKIETTLGENRINDKPITIVKYEDLTDENAGIWSYDNENKEKVEIYIYAGETITITYEATLTGDLGNSIDNTAAIYSLTNDKVALAQATETTTVKKTIQVAKTEVAQNYNIVLLLDHSNSMKVKDLEAVYSGVKTLLGDEYIGGKLFDNMNKNNESDSAISMINFWGSAETKHSNLKTKNEIEEAINKDYKNATFLDNRGGTNYSKALEKAEEEFNKMNSNNKNILVFFTDGAPTDPAAGLAGMVGYTIHSEDNKYYYWKHPLVGISKREEGGLGEKIWLKGNNGLNKYRGIQQIVDDMKNNNTDIYCINYGDSNSEYGLKNIISSWKEENQKYYAYANDEVGVTDAFESIGNSILNSDIGEINYSPATSNKIKLEKPEKITYIQVGDHKYERGTDEYNSKIEVENGETYLNLENVDLNQTITIIY